MAEADLESPLGALRVTVNEHGAVVGVCFLGGVAARTASDPGAAAARQLAEYFAGERAVFDLELAPAGTSFERRVWEEVARIPFGTTASYGEIARRLGDPALSRAVGLANARNPIAIVIPCHRVVGGSGELTGYAGGLWRKRWLLGHESGQQRLDF